MLILESKNRIHVHVIPVSAERRMMFGLWSNHAGRPPWGARTFKVFSVVTHTHNRFFLTISHSAQMYGPGRRMTSRPVSLARCKKCSRSRSPVKFWTPSTVSWKFQGTYLSGHAEISQKNVCPCVFRTGVGRSYTWMAFRPVMYIFRSRSFQ